jgi:hypothetical protein
MRECEPKPVRFLGDRRMVSGHDPTQSDDLFLDVRKPGGWRLAPRDVVFTKLDASVKSLTGGVPLKGAV